MESSDYQRRGRGLNGTSLVLPSLRRKLNAADLFCTRNSPQPSLARHKGPPIRGGANPALIVCRWRLVEFETVVSEGRVDRGSRSGEYCAYFGFRNWEERTNNRGIELRSA